ncbi:MAG: hypothetical protein C4520_08710 [Candidatus Abyssobacteria bacterium SURF_5]|uniref:DUF5320 domain-containing protein n=1 Tax=Abyssobacteria bacterium (strain SURF_5) TaxID=2093360 RepID=A0A3A4NNI3_ABYX5|nr:MAG: hypothetical protein C4520_08710 [Candidatus Abyssubacteria bacterium SURF_5]
MPRGDGTGPMGAGPMTGRAAGYCAGYGVPGSMNPAFPGAGRGRGGFWGRGGGGRGRRNWFYATGVPGWARFGSVWPQAGWGPSPVGPTREQELEALQQQASYFNEALEDIKQRIDELSKEKKS